MHATTALLIAIAGSAAAQMTATSSASLSMPSSESGCGESIDNIIASCLSSTQAQLDACATNDWDCMCTQQTNVMVCYNNCMTDPARSAAESQQVSWCNAAHPFGTTTTAGASQTSGLSHAQTSDASPTGTSTTGDDASPSSSDDASSSPTDNAALANAVPGALAAFFGLVVLL